MKQTAVEWLNEQMNNIKSSSTKMYGTVQFLEKELTKLLEQAKEMEKEQIETAFIKGNEFLSEWNITNVPYIDAEQYYNETFKSE
jgi:phage shock protein A